ncbi:hypothetical protein DAPPUDRAFT_250615 [Daphnia pulex]|uniref:Uncharacterized protein n=1 Tax=Daphnia pulex TaxID=6669 RepID=E9GYY6_DAPPU|nr:hypothetical protein DAPPUDRAFT_250615 [Daphnia pulex]|eukprot:EFX75235.1 hypothetical protein DAPPUDRAFT_250615 [Daphnia pulex]
MEDTVYVLGRYEKGLDKQLVAIGMQKGNITPPGQANSIMPRKGSDEVYLVLATLLNLQYPQLLISYYENLFDENKKLEEDSNKNNVSDSSPPDTSLPR